MRAKRRYRKGLSALAVTAALIGPVLVAVAPSAAAAPTSLDPGLAVVNIASGLNQPTAVRFAPDGRFFVAEKGGLIKAYSAIGAPVVTVADLQTEVNNFWDRGMLGLEIDKDFLTTRPYLYALYVRDAVPGGPAPRWGDSCPTPPGSPPASPPMSTKDGCVVGARLVRIMVNRSTNAEVPGTRLTLIDSTATTGWCFQFPSHAIGTVRMNTADGQLYVGAGDGASFTGPDYGQLGGTLPSPSSPVTLADPCGRNPGTPEQPPSAVGGAFRSQAPRLAGMPGVMSWYDGSIVRVDPDTGTAATVAFGLRNPFRFNFRPGTSELWVGDVGYNTWEEIDRFTPGASPGPNFGWPCYEGIGKLADYQNLNTDACMNLMPAEVTAPFYTYQHGLNPDYQTNCGPGAPATGGNSVIGGTFYSGSEWPSQYSGAYVFGDYSRRCIWAMRAAPGGDPDPSSVVTLVRDTGVVDLQSGPAGDLVWADLGTGLNNGGIYRLRSTAANLPPVPAFSATPQYGSFDIHFDASATTDPNVGDVVSYSWTFGDGGTAATRIVDHHYGSAAVRTVTLTATDQLGASASTTLQVGPGVQPPQIGITATETALGRPPDGAWRAGDTIAFTANVSGGAAPFSYQWTAVMHHCEAANPTACHAHPDIVGPLPNAPSGSFSAPDHSYPSYLELQLTVTDALGIPVSTSIAMHPATSTLSVSSYPSGLPIGVATDTITTPAAVTLITGTTATLAAPSEQLVGGTAYQFAGWSDGVSTETRSLVLGATTAITANYLPIVSRINVGDGGLPDPLFAWSADTGTGGSAVTSASTISNRPVGTPAALFQSQRQGQSSWAIPLSPGQYEVRTFFCELDGSTAPGARTVTVNAEGATIVNALDVRAAAGAPNVGIRRTATVTVTDGTLNIDVVGGAGTPMLSGIEVLAHAKGYWMADVDGRVYAFGTAYHGQVSDQNIVDIQSSPTGSGYWTLNNHGRVHAFGDARFYGDQPALGAGERVTAMTATKTGNGYWLFTNVGRAINYGDAVHYGDLVTLHLVPNGPVLRAITTSTGAGYYMVGSDGGIFSFGDAQFYGSMGDQRLNAPVQSLVPDPDGVGYWLVASDGGVFAFQAPFRGSMGDKRLNAPVTGMVAFGNGYLMVARDGGIFDFSDQPFLGSLGDQTIPAPVVAVAGFTGA